MDERLPVPRRALIQMRVKIKALAAEAAINRMEERRARSAYLAGKVSLAQYEAAMAVLISHRRGTLRHIARMTLLAYAMLRGKPRANCEQNAKPLTAGQVMDLLTVVRHFAGTKWGPHQVEAWASQRPATLKDVA